jgi:hypothetical protein
MRSNNLEDLKKYIKTKMKGSENIWYMYNMDQAGGLK